MEQSFLGNSETPIGPVADNERILDILSHILTLFFSFIPPLIIYILKKDESRFVESHAKESLNFQITLVIAYIVAFILIIVLVGILAFIFIGFFQLILVIIATIRAADNQLYRYPFTIRFIK